MTPAPPPYPPAAPAGGPSRPRWLLPVVAGAAALLMLCSMGGVVAVAGQEPTSYGAGTWEVGSEIPPGTYVTTAPSGSVLDSCYWARLAGFTGDFDEIIANGNLNAGARGRLTVADGDAGVEFSGRCRWVDATDADPIDVGDEVGEGIWAVGDEIPPGTYTTTASDGGVLDSCYWARLAGFTGDFDEIIANGIVDAGARGRVEVQAGDAGVEFSGDCAWTRS